MYICMWVCGCGCGWGCLCIYVCAYMRVYATYVNGMTLLTSFSHGSYWKYVIFNTKHWLLFVFCLFVF